MAASRPGNTDRGWNDPPMFDYQGSVTAGHMGTGSPQHTKLNKRVAYPMSSPTVPASPTCTSPLLNPSEGPPRLPPIQILPPVSTTSTPVPVPVFIPTLSLTADSMQQPALFSPLDSAAFGTPGGAPSKVKVLDLPDLVASLSLESEESLLPFVKDGLASALESVKDAIQGRTLEDVRKKLALMEESWVAGKITPPVKSQLGSLVSAIKKGEMGEANELHLALMINHTAEVHHWLVGVKRIVQELQGKESQHSQSAEAPGAENAASSDPCMDVPAQTVPLCMPLETPGAALTQNVPQHAAGDDRDGGNAEEPAAGDS
ncbi:hypothetical protein ACOMHN_018730 [Nucella lapillus]